MAEVLDTVDFFGSLFNTVVVAVAGTALVLFFDSLAAFAFAKYEFPAKRLLFGPLLVTYIGIWNDYIWPLVVMIDPEEVTLQVALANLNVLYATDYSLVMAGALMSVVPLIVVLLIGARHFLRDFAAGAMKM